MTGERTYPVLPCADLDDALIFYVALGFTVSFQQRRPNPYAVVELDDIAIHLAAIEGFDPATSYGSAIITVADPGARHDSFKAGLLEDDHRRRGDLLQQGRPGGGRFSRAPLPGQYLQSLGDGNEQAPGADPDPIDQDLMVNRLDRPEARLDGPAPGGAVTQGSAGRSALGFGLRLLADQPGQELDQLVSAGHVAAFADAGGPAVRAPPPLRSGRSSPATNRISDNGSC